MKNLRPALPPDKSPLTIVRNGFQLNDKLIIKTKSEIHFIDQNTIIYLEASSNYCMVFYEDNKRMLVSKTLGLLSKQLKQRFVRIHSRYIVNIENIVKIDLKNNIVFIHNGQEFPVSRTRKKTILDLIKSIK